MRGHRDEVRAELGIEPHEIVFGTVANFRREKAYEVMLEAARLALQSELPMRFVAVGQGPARGRDACAPWPSSGWVIASSSSATARTPCA